MLDGGEKEKLILGKNSVRVRSRCRAAPPRPAPGRPWRSASRDMLLSARFASRATPQVLGPRVLPDAPLTFIR